MPGRFSHDLGRDCSPSSRWRAKERLDHDQLWKLVSQASGLKTFFFHDLQWLTPRSLAQSAGLFPGLGRRASPATFRDVHVVRAVLETMIPSPIIELNHDPAFGTLSVRRRPYSGFNDPRVPGGGEAIEIAVSPANALLPVRGVSFESSSPCGRPRLFDVKHTRRLRTALSR